MRPADLPVLNHTGIMTSLSSYLQRILNLSTHFPLMLDTRWVQPEDLSIPDYHLKNWLLDTGSLTERLQSHCRQFRVQLLGQAMAPLSEDEQCQMTDMPCEVREVLLCGEAQPWVFARSLLPVSLIHQGMQELAQLGEQSLGKVLFNRSDCVREPFEITRIPADHALLQTLGIDSTHDVWGRRSRFSYRHWHMMVAEIFLPGSPAYKQFGGLGA